MVPRMASSSARSAPISVDHAGTDGSERTPASRTGRSSSSPETAACANAYARATGTQHNRFPILEHLS